MPKRPKQHEIDEMAQRIFKDALPPSWVVNPLSPDYAKDYLVEVVENRDVTGRVHRSAEGKAAPHRQNAGQNIHGADQA